MFGRRSDGKRIKTLPPEFKIIPNLMVERSDSQVFFKQDVGISSMDEYIDKKAKENIKISYMDIIYAAIVRIIAERPQLNRFIANKNVFARNDISVSLSIKKSLSEEGDETTLKIHYRGDETLFQVKEKLQKEIARNKDVNQENSTDKTADMLGKVPNWLFRFLVSCLKKMDKHGMLPKSIIEASPFHTSVFLTNVGSLGIDAIYHHIYNFGTTSMFFAMGRKKKSYVYEDDEIRQEKCITLAFVGDERICDGYYYASSFKALTRYLKHPELLEEPGIIKKDIL